MAVILHKKVNRIASFTQAQLDQQIAYGNFPPGTTLADITLAQDWNDSHDVSQLVPVTPVLVGPYNIAAASGLSVFTIYNSGSAPITLNLPPAPAINQIAQIVDAGLTAGTYTITINGNGKSVCAYGSVASSAGIVSNGGSISLAWDGIQWTQLS